ncbi:hypothetical protein M409DRAFT_26442 [Zasmidium cellare ATCC 36951]|uniref:Uncharacterized protein n=1 Tax=Zasmidium cellare ATCC 36951 TaxID=1080233 RepID=A0A6A6C7A1_ZASCE|nr:uncharacterized protein M409DRAFT_26442 [Zasmidium cellare ATCC 36951]KAF2162994.1 hypothetical protein M409DRAFT_26442 [Zasmidium cellare ATCC 36951]
MAPQRQPLPRHGSSQMSDLDVQSDMQCPPTPLLEGRHMLRREKPLDLEKCQDSTRFSKEVEGGKQIYALFGVEFFPDSISSTEKDDLVRASNKYHALQVALWIFIWFGGPVVISIVGCLPKESLAEHETLIKSTVLAVVIAMIIALHQLTVLAVKTVVQWVGDPTDRISRVWLCCYSLLTPLIAIAMAARLGVSVQVSINA